MILLNSAFSSSFPSGTRSLHDFLWFLVVDESINRRINQRQEQRKGCCYPKEEWNGPDDTVWYPECAEKQPGGWLLLAALILRENDRVSSVVSEFDQTETDESRGNKRQSHLIRLSDQSGTLSLFWSPRTGSLRTEECYCIIISTQRIERAFEGRQRCKWITVNRFVSRLNEKRW